MKTIRPLHCHPEWDKLGSKFVGEDEKDAPMSHVWRRGRALTRRVG